MLLTQKTILVTVVLAGLVMPVEITQAQSVNFKAASEAYESGDYDRAIKLYNSVEPTDTNFIEAMFRMSKCLAKVGKYDPAKKLLEAVILHDPDIAAYRNELAWFLATVKDKNMRDGKEAIEHANKACELTRFRDARTLDIAAAAYAADGQFVMAIDPNAFDIQAMDAFKNKMAIGDLVVISDGNRKFRAIARVTGEYKYADQAPRQIRPVEWLTVLEESLPREMIYNKSFSQMCIYRFRKKAFKLDALRELLTGKPAGPRSHVLIIDEINRGNIAKILGELITLLEPDKRLGAANELQLRLPNSGDLFGVPKNLYVIGTMNTADRSIALLDTALRRRFRFVEMMPDSQVVKNEVGKNGVVDNVDLANLLETINRRVELLFDRDHQIGHAYFIGVESLADLRDVFLVKIIPLLQEYFYGDWTRVCAVLGCPFDPEDGKPLTKNSHPLISASLLSVEDLPGGSGNDFGDRVRCSIAPNFANAASVGLQPFFDAIIKPAND